MGEEPRSTLNPHLLMEMVTGWSPDGPVKCSMTEDEILRLWDAMVESLRLRPTGPGDGKDGGPDPAPRGEPVEPGRRVASGNLCPADGLWRCDHPDNLLGHQRFYKAGTKFLAAVVPAKHGPLAKLFRRPQERWVPTTWTLLPREPEESAGR
jgi:hypothetical protein